MKKGYTHEPASSLPRFGRPKAIIMGPYLEFERPKAIITIDVIAELEATADVLGERCRATAEALEEFGKSLPEGDEVAA